MKVNALEDEVVIVLFERRVEGFGTVELLRPVLHGSH